MKTCNTSWWRRVAIGVMSVAMGIVIGGCGSSAPTNEGKLPVVASVYPVYDVAKQVGGDKIALTLLVPPGSEPHDWEPSSSDLMAIGKAKLFLYNGAGLEPTEKIVTKDVLRDAKAIELSKAVRVLPMPHEDSEGEMAKESAPSAVDKSADGHDHEHGSNDHEHGSNDHEHGSNDPHVWLDPTNVMLETDAVVKAFSEADPANAEYYKKNGEAYKEKLAKLDAQYQDWAQGVQQKNLVVTHEAFGYLAHRYGLHQLGIMGISPDAEPTPEKMARIVAFVKANGVKAIFSEELVNPKLAEAIAKEAGATVYMLNPVEGLTKEQMDKGATYLSVMEENLATLKKAMQ